MRYVINMCVVFVGVIAVLAGLYFLALAVSTPGQYNLAQATAPQMTQVYSEGIYRGVLAVGCFVFAAVCALSSRNMPMPNPDAPEPGKG